MDWELTLLTVLGVIGYFHLLKTTKQGYVTAMVRLHLESRELDVDNTPSKLEEYDKFCRFIITPVPGMEFMASDIEGAIIRRVIIDELGGLEVICQLTITDSDNEFNDTCKHLASQGWNKKHYV